MHFRTHALNNFYHYEFLILISLLSVSWSCTIGLLIDMFYIYIVQCYLLFNYFYDFHFLDKVCLVSVCDNILIRTVFEYFLSTYVYLYYMLLNLNCFSLFVFCPLLGYADLECEIGNYPRNVVTTVLIWYVDSQFDIVDIMHGGARYIILVRYSSHTTIIISGISRLLVWRGPPGS